MTPDPITEERVTEETAAAPELEEAELEPEAPEIIEGQEEPQPVTPDQARAVLAEATRKRVALCGQEVEAVLRRFGCEIVTRAMLTSDGRITSGWRIDPTE